MRRHNRPNRSGFLKSGLLLFLWAGLHSVAVSEEAPLFSSHSVMELTIPLDFKTLCRPRETPDCGYTPTVLEFEDEDGQKRSIPIEVRIRGGWRSLSRNCSAPLLFIRFDESGTAGTPFEGQGMLPLTTHCGQGLTLEATKTRKHRTVWEQYLLREYLAHRLYNVLTEFSLNARLVHMTYPNPEKPSRRVRNYAFFTEHFESLAARTRTELLPRGSFDAEKLDANAANRLALFQFMIGNTDWSIVRQRNTILLQNAKGEHVPAPYDFDMSGLVNAHYAGPPPDLPIETVRERYFLGFCHPDNDWEALFATFLRKEAPLKAMIDEPPDLDRSSLKWINRFLDRFFWKLYSDETRQEYVVDRCQPWPPSLIDHTTPQEMR